jgi:hypothetical protein
MKFENTQEQLAHDKILEWCRKESGRVMRIGTPPFAPECRVIDLRRPPSSEVLVESSTWVGCFVELMGFDLDS